MKGRGCARAATAASTRSRTVGTVKVRDASESEMSENDGAEQAPEEEPPKLTMKDYLALAIASLETVLLPLLVLIVILVVLTLAFAGHL